MHDTFGPLLGFLFIGSAITFLLSALAFIFWIWMLIDAIQNPRLVGNQKVVWVLVVIFLPCLGPLLYFFLGRSK
jgi:hypothetical protein